MSMLALTVTPNKSLIGTRYSQYQQQPLGNTDLPRSLLTLISAETIRLPSVECTTATAHQIYTVSLQAKTLHCERTNIIV